MTLRSPIMCILGHVDHGKTSIADRIRGTAIAAKEPGLITQHVGASFVPTSVIEKRCSKLIEKHKFKLTIPGLLMIDTPGHEAFMSLRVRGGSIADLAALVIDVAQGMQPQTLESIEILKQHKTPFIVAANKIDLIDGWEVKPDSCFTESFVQQREFVQQALDEKLYQIMGKLSELGFDSERFDRVSDITKQVLIIPVSAKTGEGFPELLLFLAALAQKFMEEKLHVDLDAPAQGTILEVKEVTGLGTTLDTIIYEGSIKVGDRIAFASGCKPIIASVRALLQPAPLEEIRDPSKRFKTVEKVYAAAGIKIAASGIEGAVPGSPLIVVKDEQEALEQISREISEICTTTENLGVIIKADALGSLEALNSLFTKAGITIRRADIGEVTKRDVMEARSVRLESRYNGIVFAFNTQVNEEAKKEANTTGVPIISADVIYKLEDDYKKWCAEEQEREKKEIFSSYTYPAKITILPHSTFRISKPAIVGIEVLGGIIKQKMQLMNVNGEVIGKIESIQHEKQTIEKAEKGNKVAISIDGATVGRQIKEKDTLYSAVPLEQLYELKKTFEDKKLVNEIIKIKEQNKGDKR